MTRSSDGSHHAPRDVSGTRIDDQFRFRLHPAERDGYYAWHGSRHAPSCRPPHRYCGQLGRALRRTARRSVPATLDARRYPWRRMLWVLCFLTGCRGDPVAELSQQLQDPDVNVRRHASATLLKMGRDAKPAITALGGALTDKDREVRRLAIRAIGNLGPEAESYMPALRHAFEDQEFSVRLAAAMAIHELDPAEKTHTTVLIEAMKMGEGGTIVAVGRYGASATWAVPTLISLLQDHRAGIRRIAADALGKIGPAASAAEGALKQAAKDDADDRVRDAANEALQSVRRTAAT